MFREVWRPETNKNGAHPKSQMSRIGEREYE